MATPNYAKVFCSLLLQRCQKGLLFCPFCSLNFEYIWKSLLLLCDKKRKGCGGKQGVRVGVRVRQELLKCQLPSDFQVHIHHMSADLWVASRTGKAISLTEREREREEVSPEPFGCAFLCFLPGVLFQDLLSALQGLMNSSTPKGEHLL